MLHKKDKKILEKIKLERNWSQSTYYAYENSIKIYAKFTKKNFYELLNEAEKEEIEGIRWKDRTLLKRLISFKSYLILNYMGDSVKDHFGRIKSIYKHFFIEIHHLPYVSEKSIQKNKPISFENIPSKKIIKKSIELSKPDMTAIILFISSSGCARAETLNLTIYDFINATKNYHDIDLTTKNITIQNENIELLINTLTKQNDIIPAFEIKRQKTNKYYHTFCSPEATKAILNYLILRNDSLNYNSKLFKTNRRYFYIKFKFLNNKMKLGKAGKYPVFSSHMLRKYHASNLIKKGDNGYCLTEQQVDSLQGRGKTGSRNSYMYEDVEALKKEYIKCLDNIIIYGDNSIDFRTEKYLELEKELKQQAREYEQSMKNKESETDELRRDIDNIKELLNKKLKI